MTLHVPGPETSTSLRLPTLSYERLRKAVGTVPDMYLDTLGAAMAVHYVTREMDPSLSLIRAMTLSQLLATLGKPNRVGVVVREGCDGAGWPLIRPLRAVVLADCSSTLGGAVLLDVTAYESHVLQQECAPAARGFPLMTVLPEGRLDLVPQDMREKGGAHVRAGSCDYTLSLSVVPLLVSERPSGVEEGKMWEDVHLRSLDAQICYARLAAERAQR